MKRVYTFLFIVFVALIFVNLSGCKGLTDSASLSPLKVDMMMQIDCAEFLGFNQLDDGDYFEYPLVTFNKGLSCTDSPKTSNLYSSESTEWIQEDSDGVEFVIFNDRRYDQGSDVPIYYNEGSSTCVTYPDEASCDGDLFFFCVWDDIEGCIQEDMFDESDVLVEYVCMRDESDLLAGSEGNTHVAQLFFRCLGGILISADDSAECVPCSNNMVGETTTKPLRSR